MATEMPRATLARRALPWIILVAVLVAGVTLSLIYGPRVVPFFTGVSA
jgi:hypothetical protein